MEREAEISAMMSEIRRFSPEKREKVGRAINNMTGKNLGKELGFNMVKYGRKNAFETEINIGDLVLISKGNPLKSKLTGTVAEKGKRFITLAMETVPPWSLKEVRIDLYANDITFRRMLENLRKLSPSGEEALKFLLKTENQSNHADKKSKKIQNTLILQDKKLNSSQKVAISRAMETPEFFLIHGPFGTGKTRTLLELIKQEVKRGNKVLATAESNTAVDNILEGLQKEADCVRLGHPQRVSRKNIEHCLAYKVENHPLYSKIIALRKDINKVILERDKFHKPLPGFRRGLSDTQIVLNAVKRRGSRGVSPNVMISMAGWIENNKKIDQKQALIQKIEDNIVKDILKRSSVVLCTNSSAGLEFLKDIKFQLVVVDESSQTTIPSILIPLSKASRFILAGDHRQLPPTVLNQKAKELENTLFEKLIHKYPENSFMLNYQYRMNPSLMDFPNQEFYNGEIKAAHEVKKISINDLTGNNLQIALKSYNPDETDYKNVLEYLIDNEQPLYFLDTANCDSKYEKHLKGSTSIQNPFEADLANIISHLFIKNGIELEKMGIITPYDDQVDLIKSHTQVEVSTVDGFQGREKDIIIISMVRSNLERKIGFLNDLRRLNVSLTRARRKLIIIGDTYTLKTHPTYAHLIKYTHEHGFLVDANDLI